MSSYDLEKRVLDLTIAIILLILFLPVWIIVPILIKLDSPGPVIFKHRRMGKNGKEFYLLKFRSMILNAHDYLHQQNPELLKKFKAGDWKLKNDPRITKLGKILRSITIDEWPQLINVLKGEMSMVGPRAYMRDEMEDQLKRYPASKANLKKALTVKPGLTGPWQVSGRNAVPFVKRVELDAAYASSQSISNDLRIILKTPAAMFSKW